MQNCDIAIIGGGPVGAALALALRDSNFSITVLEARSSKDGQADPRALALSYGSRLLLDDASQYTARDPIARDTSGRRPRSLTYSASQHHTGLRAALYLRPSCAAALPVRRAP